ncbi:MAG: ATP-dependent helicase [Methanomassiliicoccales archaeon]|nr:ATP-dependent helicase [Methanomassiliicoccales archaeon]NYT15237.1 ATP-dependent helicase [Methanomassiliicoccales archaeon]
MERINRRGSKEEVMGLMEPLIEKWFTSRFEGLTEPQSYAIPLIHERRSVLVSSPTGSGKTLTAFLSIINELFKYAEAGELEDRIYAIYISPLKALANDINRNLEEPLREMRSLAAEKGIDFPDIRVGVRSGDTTPYERQKQLRKPPHIFITTPESLSLILAAPKFKERFSEVEWIIVDEIHEICDSKRGVHLSLTLERLQDFCSSRFVRVGLSATLAPMEKIAGFLSGYENGEQRDIALVEAEARKDLDMEVICPAEDMTALPFEIVNAKMYDTLKEMIERHTTTLVFTNTRSGTESVVYKLKERGLEDIEAHHGSLSKETRLNVEERLKNGELKCVVSSTSLELGIDIGSIDLVCQIGSPKSVAKGLQRIGRSGHGYGQTAKGRMLVMDNDDLVECAVLSRAAHGGRVDRVTIPENSLDVLAQNIVGMSIERRWDFDEAFEVVRRSYCYRNLPRESFMDVIRYLSSKDEFEGVYSKIWYDEDEGRFGRKRGSRMIYSMNIGTIPEEANYRVFTDRGAMVGDLSEKFAERLSPNDVFVLGGKTYQFRRIKGMKAFVTEAHGRKPTVPSWTGEMLPRSFDLSMEIARFRREMAQRLGDDDEATILWLCESFDVDRGSARTILSYFEEQLSSCQTIPDDRRLAVEGYIDMGGRYNIVFHFPFGRRLNDAFSRAYAFQITKLYGCNTSVSVTDDAFMITSPKKVDLSEMAGMVSSSNLEAILRKAVKDSELFKQRFRHTAARSFMVLRAYKGRQVSVNRQQVRSSYLLDSLGQMTTFPVIEETYREILRDVMDLENAEIVLDMLERGEMEITIIDYSSAPSPFAHGVILSGISDLVLMEDRSALLKELHRKVLAKVMADELDVFEFDAEKVTGYFRRKIEGIQERADIPRLLSAVGPLRIFKERGRSIYPFSEVDRRELDSWARDLLREGEISSVYIDDVYFVATEDLTSYATLLRRERRLGDLENAILDRVDELSTVKELSESLDSSPEIVLASLRKLESAFLMGRADHDGSRWYYARRDLSTVPREGALDRAVTKYLNAFAPATVEEVAYALNLREGEVNITLDDMVREGLLTKGRFLVSEHDQYMLRRDYLRLRSDSLAAYDHRTVEEYRRSKQSGPFETIEDCIRFLGEVGLPFDVFLRVPEFDMGSWAERRESGKTLLGRFLRGRVRYILAQDAPMFVSAFREAGLTQRDLNVLDLITRHEGLTLRQLVSMTDLGKEQIKESLDRLDRNMYVVRMFTGNESWSSENVYVKCDIPSFDGDPKAAIVERFIRAHGPVPLTAIRHYTRFGKHEILDALLGMELETISVGEEGTEMFLMADELKALESFEEGDSSIRIRSLYDPAVQPKWAEVSSRYGDRWIFPILQGARLVGAIEKWNMSGFVEIRSLDLDDEALLPQVIEAIDEVMRFHSMNGLDVLRVTEVMGTSVSELPVDIEKEFTSRGFMRIGNFLAKGALIPDSFAWDDLLAHIIRKQGISTDSRYENVLEGVKVNGGFRSDAEAYMRCKVPVPLKKLQQQRLLERVNIIPGYMTYTDLDSAALYARAKDHTKTEDMAAILRIVRERSSLKKDEVYDLSPVGKRGTYEALRALHKGGYLFSDHRWRVRAVSDSDLSVWEAKREVIRRLFQTFGVFTAENLQRHIMSEFPMREVRSILTELEAEDFLAKGFLDGDSGSLHWIMKDDLDKMGTAIEDRFVLTPEDNLYSYLRPWIKERFEGLVSLIFYGTDVIGTFKSKKRGSDIIILDFHGDDEAKEVLGKHIRSLKLTIRGEESDTIPDWEIQEFYEKTHPGSV